VKVENRNNALFSSFKMESVDPLAVREPVDSMDTVDVSTCPAGARFPPEDYVASVIELGLPLGSLRLRFRPGRFSMWRASEGSRRRTGVCRDPSSSLLCARRMIRSAWFSPWAAFGQSSSHSERGQPC